MGQKQRFAVWGNETVGVTAKESRLFVEVVLYRYRAGIPWCGLPKRFEDFCIIHIRHTRWSKKGIWKRVFEALTEEADDADGRVRNRLKERIVCP